jgi:hypothetical protein
MISDAELEEIRRRARQYRKIDLNAEPPKPLQGQCLRDAVAVILRQPPASVPPRLEGQDVDEWLDDVGQQFGVRFQKVDGDELPPPTPRPWVAFVATADDEVTHALPCIGRSVMGVEAMIRPRAGGVLTGLVIEVA